MNLFKSYHCLKWNLTNDNDSKIHSTTPKRNFISQYGELRKSNTEASRVDYDQDIAEDFYRNLDSIRFKFNPKNFSVDCFQSAKDIQNKLLVVMGDDTIFVNDTRYFDEARTRFQSKLNLVADKRDRRRIRTESHRTLHESHTINLQHDKQLRSKSSISTSKAFSKRKVHLKPLKAVSFQNSTSSECIDFVVEPATLSGSADSEGHDVSPCTKSLVLLSNTIQGMYSESKDYMLEALFKPKKVYNIPLISKNLETGQYVRIPSAYLSRHIDDGMEQNTTTDFPETDTSKNYLQTEVASRIGCCRS